jgi:hypothetical protein
MCGTPPYPFDEHDAHQIAEHELDELIADGGEVSLHRFASGWVATCEFESPRAPGDAVLVVFSDGTTAVYPSWSAAYVAERAQLDYDRRHSTGDTAGEAGTPDVDGWGWKQ